MIIIAIEFVVFTCFSLGQLHHQYFTFYYLDITKSIT